MNALIDEDFEGGTNGVQPTGWSTAWEGGTWTVRAEALNKKLQCAPNAANSNRVLVYDASDGLNAFEAVVRTKQGDGDSSAGRGGISFNVTGTAGTSDGYRCNIQHSTGSTANGDQIALVRHDDNAATVLGTLASFSSPVQGWTWVKVRKIGSDIKVKAWVDGTAEPASWNIEVTDATYSAGKIGVYCRSGAALSGFDPPFDFDNFSITRLNTASVTLTGFPANESGIAIDVSVDRDSPPFYSATGQSANGSGELAIAATGCPLATGTRTVWIRCTNSDGLAGGVSNNSRAFYAPVSVTVS